MNDPSETLSGKVRGRVARAAGWRLRRLLGVDSTAAERQAALDRADRATEFQVSVMSCARSIAAHGERRVLIPSLSRADGGRPLRVGFVGNIANNAYNTVRCLRRAGVDAELVIEDGWFDRFLMNRPFWEDVAVRCASYEEGLTFESQWRPESFVRAVAYDASLQERYQNRTAAVDEIRALYQQTFGAAISVDRALLLAQFMGHWPLIQSLRRYDVVQFSGEALTIAMFCPVPVVAYPTGSDLFVSPFEETLPGLAMRAAFTGADAVLAGESVYGHYLNRLRRASYQPAPLMLDTERYAPDEAPETRARWQAAVGGSRFLLCSCRQAWTWKGNDTLIRAFAEWSRGSGAEWRLILQQWGPDLQNSRDLIDALGIAGRVHWEPLCSKPVLREHQRAADLCADQFAYDGACGTSVLEAMAAGKAVVMRPPSAEQMSYFPTPPPFIAATDVASATVALEQMADDGRRREAGQRHLQWVRDVHGVESRLPTYMNVYRQIGRAS